MLQLVDEFGEAHVRRNELTSSVSVGNLGDKLKQFKPNFIQAEMVKAFIVSSEYRGRFAN